MSHREEKHWQGEYGGDLETPRHIPELRVVVLVARLVASPCGVSFQRHAAHRAVAGFVRFHAGAHRAEVFCGGRRAHVGVVPVVIVMMMGMARVSLVGSGFRGVFAATAGGLGIGDGLSLAFATGRQFRRMVVFDWFHGFAAGRAFRCFHTPGQTRGL